MTAVKRAGVAGAVLAAIVIAGTWRSTAAQTARPVGSDEVLPALLQEVKGLRAAMEQMAASNAHAQLLVGRLQLQESRMNSMIRRLDTVRDERAKAEAGYAQINSSLKMLESDRSPNDPPQDDRNQMLAMIKRQIETAKASVDRWAAEEAQLTADLSAEQARWIDINQRLDELERSLRK